MNETNEIEQVKKQTLPWTKHRCYCLQQQPVTHKEVTFFVLVDDRQTMYYKTKSKGQLIKLTEKNFETTWPIIVAENG